ncbi:MAG: DUF6524 family protein [Pseudomonadota bacterium]
MGFIGFLLRMCFGVGLVLATYNPTGTSWVQWVADGFETDLPLKVLAGVVLLIGYVIVLRASFRSIGVIGKLLAAALLAALAWVAYDYGYLNVEDEGLIEWLVLVAMGLILGLGLSWSHIRRMISGQADMDDVDQ